LVDPYTKLERRTRCPAADDIAREHAKPVLPERGDLAGDEEWHFADRLGIDGRDSQDIDAGVGECELYSRQVVRLADRHDTSRACGTVPGIEERRDVGDRRLSRVAGWIDEEQLVDITGQSIAPKLYLALGISGETTHFMAIQGAGTIVAVQADPTAPIAQVADWNIFADPAQFAQALLDKLGA